MQDQPKIIEGKARRRPPLSKPLALLFIVFGLGLLTWAFFNRTDGPETFFFVALIAAGTGGLIASLLNEID